MDTQAEILEGLLGVVQTRVQWYARFVEGEGPVDNPVWSEGGFHGVDQAAVDGLPANASFRRYPRLASLLQGEDDFGVLVLHLPDDIENVLFG